MERCDTEILTFTDGKRMRFSARGEISADGETVVVRYFDDGDAVTLSVGERTLSMLREGKISAFFAAGERTVMKILSGETCGEIGVDTETLCIRKTESDLWIRLRYRLLFSAGEEKYTLKISIRIISEEE